MRKRICAICLCAALLFSLAACGSDSASEETAVSSTPEISSAAEESTAESAAESAPEESAAEEIEPTIDEQFSEFIATAQGVCLKLQIYTQKGLPVRNGTVDITAAEAEIVPDTLANTADDSSLAEELPAEDTGEQDILLYTAETDFDGYMFLSDLEFDRDYTLTVCNTDGALIGTVTLTIVSGEDYAGSSETEGQIILSVSDGALSTADLAITATDENGAESSFSLSRMDKWVFPEDETL